jgi:hypothetical protein
MKTRNLQRTTPNIQLRSGEINPAMLFGFRELGKGSSDIKKNGAAKLFSNLQASGACASLEEPFT